MGESDVPEIGVDELVTVRAGGAVVFDVREPDEYAEAHVPGAVLVPLGEVTDRIGEFPTDRPVHVICRSGARSMRAAEHLRANGVDAINVGGGTLAWLEAGQPVASGPEPG